jgi:mono/diheme cytochrome c family protein
MKNSTPALAGLIGLCLLSISCGKETTQPVDCTSSGPSLTALVTSTSCSINDGSLQLTATGGKQPYQYSLDGTTFNATNAFASLGAGNYTVTVKDANNCTSTASASIGVNQSSISYESAVKNIIATNCAVSGCHVAGTGRANFTEFTTIQARAAQIKTRTGNRSMPLVGTLTDAQIQQIACWVDAGAPNN